MAKEKCWTPLQRQVRVNWLRIIEKQADSLMEVKEFCAREKIPISTFYKWRLILEGYCEAEMHQVSPESSAFWDSPPAFPAFAAVAVAGVGDQDIVLGFRWFCDVVQAA